MASLNIFFAIFKILLKYSERTFKNNVCIVYIDTIMVVIFYCPRVMNIDEVYNIDYNYCDVCMYDKSSDCLCIILTTQ